MLVADGGEDVLSFLDGLENFLLPFGKCTLDSIAKDIRGSTAHGRENFPSLTQTLVEFLSTLFLFSTSFRFSSNF